MEKIFRIIIIISTVFTVLLWVLPYYDYAKFTRDEFNVLSWAGYGAQLPFNEVFSLGLLAVWLVINLCLYFFIKPFKSIFTIVVVITCIFGLFWGISIYPPIEFFIFTIVTMLDGAILTMLYLTSISTKFNSPNKSFNFAHKKHGPDAQ